MLQMINSKDDVNWGRGKAEIEELAVMWSVKITKYITNDSN